MYRNEREKATHMPISQNKKFCYHPNRKHLKRGKFFAQSKVCITVY